MHYNPFKRNLLLMRTIALDGKLAEKSQPKERETNCDREPVELGPRIRDFLV